VRHELRGGTGLPKKAPQTQEQRVEISFALASRIAHLKGFAGQRVHRRLKDGRELSGSRAAAAPRNGWRAALTGATKRPARSRV
jgi:hypothetical protein